MEIKDLLSNYRSNTLTPQLLRRLREEQGALTDKELGDALQAQWNDDPFHPAEMTRSDTDRDNRMWRSLRKNGSMNGSSGWIRKVAMVAASLLLPLLLCTSLFFYRENRMLKDESVTIRTDAGERASVHLPDGSTVLLNVHSRLSYNQYRFNTGDRTIEFEGEGYFTVCPNPEAPFSVTTQEIKVTVLGTKFNLMARDSAHSIEVMLDEGSVELTDLITQRQLRLSPSQKATFAKASRRFSVVQENGEVVSSWRKGEMIFYDTPLRNVLKAIEEQYNVSIRITVPLEEDKFTGTFTTRNLIEALDMIKFAYGLQYRINAKEIIFFKK